MKNRIKSQTAALGASAHIPKYDELTISHQMAVINNLNWFNIYYISGRSRPKCRNRGPVF